MIPAMVHYRLRPSLRCQVYYADHTSLTPAFVCVKSLPADLTGTFN